MIVDDGEFVCDQLPENLEKSFEALQMQNDFRVINDRSSSPGLRDHGTYRGFADSF